MQIVTWNVNSLKARAEYVGHYLDQAMPDVIGLQELKLDTDHVPVEIFESRGYHVAMHAQKQWNGVLLASKFPLTEVARGLPAADEGQARLVSAVTGGIRVVNLYCPQGQSADSPKFPYKLRFYDALQDWLVANARPDEPLVVTGDLNIAPEPRDIWDPEGFAGVPSFHPEEHARFARLLDFGLTDAVKPHVPPNTYSFWDYRGGAFYKKRGMRIDHHLVSASVAARVERAWVDRQWRKKYEGLTPSDHAPVGIELRD